MRPSKDKASSSPSKRKRHSDAPVTCWPTHDGLHSFAIPCPTYPLETPMGMRHRTDGSMVIAWGWPETANRGRGKCHFPLAIRFWTWTRYTSGEEAGVGRL